MNGNKIKHMLTRWGEDFDKTNPLPEYPRPQMKRSDWQSLNGVWQYAILDGVDEGDIKEPEKYDGDIIVPYTPETLLSGVERQLQPGQTLWYRREIILEKPEQNKRLLLHFGAVDQRCEVFINGQKTGSHSGGYWAFNFDITDYIKTGENIITVAVHDDSNTGLEAYGKQNLNNTTIWYTAQSGIWQTVWLETIPEQHIKSIKITPLCNSSEVEFEIQLKDYTKEQVQEKNQELKQAINVKVFSGENIVAEGSFRISKFCLSLPNFLYWSPDDPFLYTVKISTETDEIESYFGMRQFGIINDDKGYPRLGLNGKPIFHNGLLDQGYWSDGMYTPPSDEAMIFDIQELKNLGFNMLRKHIKVEPLRWYYHCDRLGMLVWQDFVSGGGPYGGFSTRYLPFIGIKIRDDTNNPGFGRESKEGREIFERDMKHTVDLLYNTVSLAVWVPFNEAWGQFDSVRIASELLKLDNTRAIDHASGWHDQGAGDFKSVHVYYKKFRMKKDKHKRIQALTEFGGYSCPTEGHMATDKLFGYRMFENKEELTAAVEKLYIEQIIPQIKKGLSAAIYTQVSDIEEEINGLFTYDRKELKIDEKAMKRINEQMIL